MSRWRAEVGITSERQEAAQAAAARRALAKQRPARQLAELSSSAEVARAFSGWLCACAYLDLTAALSRERTASRAAALGSWYAFSANGGAQKRHFAMWRERVRVDAACCEKWRGLVLSALAHRRRMSLRRQTSGRHKLYRRSMLEMRRESSMVLFDALGVQRAIFALWRLWVNGVQVYEEYSMLSARRASMHSTEGPWWAQP